MRVFYIDEDEPNESMHTYYVKLENVSLPDGLKGYKAFDANTTANLIEQIRKFYKINTANIELWSNQAYQGRRLDTMYTIPKEYEFIWIRVTERRLSALLNNEDK
jgi:hypothetical protein